MRDPTSLEKDLRAIQALNQRHIEAVLSSDIDAVMSLWSDNFTILPPVGPIVRGRRANTEIVQRGMERIHAFEPLGYVEDFEETKVDGEYAFEWGTYRGVVGPGRAEI